jgi:TP901 family phage tail tape measure protein
MNLEARLKFSLAPGLKAEVTKAKGDLNALRKALSSTAEGIGKSAAANSSKNIQNVRSEIARLIKEIDRLKKAGTKNLSEATPLRRAEILGGTVAVSKGLSKGLDLAGEAKAAAQAEREQAKAIREKAAAAKQASHDLESLFYQMRKGNGEIVDFSQHAISLRYALYDVAAVARNVGANMLQFASAMVMAGAKQESAFSQVEKTLLDVDANGVQTLKDGLIELSQTIPVAFGDITNIAMLGSQLNVAQDQLIGFTDTVAKFSALSQMSAEEAAMGFGKIANVLGLVDGEGKISGDAMKYLGSAIVAVSNEAAATEAQIISTAKQIGSISTAAGIAATDTIALSSAFASLAIAPEEARGVTVQLFSEINKAANSLYKGLDSGSERLRVFAEVAGMSQKEFAAAWKDKSSQDYFRTIGEGADATTVSMNGATYAFEEFIAGLGKGYDVQDVLKKIGLDGVRTSKGITSLANGFSQLQGQIEIARKNGLEGTFLDQAYGKIADDINSKLIKIKNSFEALMAAGTDSSPMKNLLGGLLDVINAMLIGFQHITSNPIGSFITTVVVAIAGLVGVIGTLGSMLLIGAGSMLAMRTALSNAAQAGVAFNGIAMKTIATMLGFNRAQVQAIVEAQGVAIATRQEAAALATVGTGAEVAAGGLKVATAAVKGFKIALATTGVGLLLLALGAVAEGFMSVYEAATDAAEGGLNGAQQDMFNAYKIASTLKSELQELFDAYISGVTNGRKLDNALYSTGRAAKEAAGQFNTNSQAVRDYEDTVSSVIAAAVQMYGNSTGDLKAYLIQYLAFIQKTGIATKGAIDMLNGIINGALHDVAASSMTFDFSQITAGLNDVGDSARGAAEDVKTLLEVVQMALKSLNDLAGVYGSIRDLGSAIEGIGSSFNTLTDKGSEAFSSLNSSIEQIVTSANENPQKAANQLGALRKALWQVGVTSRSAYIMIDKAISATGKKAKVSAKDVTTYFKQLATGLAEATTNEVRTINDWADDIAGVIKDALEIRFRSGTAYDAITTAWGNMAEAARDAADAVSEAKQSLDEINANKNVLQYQLGIAIKYGDTLRANLLQSQINKANSDAAKASQTLADAQSKQSTALTGNSDAAIRNRGALLDLVGKYQAYLVTLAKTTTDQAKLKSEAERLRGEFESQAKALGFLPNDIKDYADSISGDFVTAINEIPTNITLKLEGDTAIVQSLKSFAIRANAVLATIKTNITPTITPKLGSAPATGATSPVVYKGGVNPNGGMPSTATPNNTVTGGNTTGGNGSGSIDLGNGMILSPVKWHNSILRDNAATPELDPDWISVSDNTVKLSRSGKPTPTSAAMLTLRARETALSNEMVKWSSYTPAQRKQQKAGHDSLVKSLYDSVKSYYSTYGYGYATGGYVSGPGTGTSDSINARLSNGEFVMKAAAVRTYGADFMNALNQMQIARPSYQGGSAAGGSSSTMVYLSPEDRALLRAAIDRPVNLYTETTKIAQSANEGNVVLARRGMK